MAQAFHGTLTALFVQTPDHAAMNTGDQKRLEEHMQLAQRLGASIETVYGDDVSYQIAEFARLNHITKIVLGRSNVRRAPSLEQAVPDRKADRNRAKSGYLHHSGCRIHAQQLSPEKALPGPLPGIFRFQTFSELF